LFVRIIIVLLFCSVVSKGQVDSVYYGKKHDTKRVNTNNNKPKEEAWKKYVTWGGNIQAWIGNPTFLLLSPTLGYIPFKNFNIGIGGIYNYTSYNSTYGNYSQSIFGGHSYARYTIANSYFVQVQYDKLLQPDLLSLEPNAKIWVDYLFVGGGFRQSISDNAALTTSIMYNVNPDLLSIYPSRIIIQFGIIGRFR
jgi:hypothetical protein